MNLVVLFQPTHIGPLLFLKYSMDTSNDSPPPFEPINIVELVSVDNSKIAGVSLYSGRAEITRVYKFSVKTGQNQINITGLPNVLDQGSLRFVVQSMVTENILTVAQRVEGRGAATIHDVTVSGIPPPPVISTSPSLVALLLKKEKTQKALERCKKSISSLEAYLRTLNVERVDVSQIGNVMESYNIEGEKLDFRMLELEKELETIQGEINVEKRKLLGSVGNDELGLRAVIGVFAESEGQVEIVLIYGECLFSLELAVHS